MTDAHSSYRIAPPGGDRATRGLAASKRSRLRRHARSSADRRAFGRRRPNRTAKPARRNCRPSPDSQRPAPQSVQVAAAAPAAVTRPSWLRLPRMDSDPDAPAARRVPLPRRARLRVADASRRNWPIRQSAFRENTMEMVLGGLAFAAIIFGRFRGGRCGSWREETPRSRSAGPAASRSSRKADLGKPGADMRPSSRRDRDGLFRLPERPCATTLEGVSHRLRICAERDRRVPRPSASSTGSTIGPAHRRLSGSRWRARGSGRGPGRPDLAQSFLRCHGRCGDRRFALRNEDQRIAAGSC